MLLYWAAGRLSERSCLEENDIDGEESAWPALGDSHRRG